ncbi:hypothetical protein DVH24_016286 [Malus domestica]|uniref:Uncharacterized protein n=2 Tax=Malus TaxID=3749 RepID=A0A498HT77_MALDO|nr:hypothetical protein DVH24_016286 [Malus domestica]
MRVGVNAEVVEAFDINDNANKVHQHNFGHRPYQGNIQSLTAADLDCLGRMHDFFLLLANFTLDKTSDTHTKMIEILGRTNFVLQEFILSLLQFGEPYSRPRYFCLVASSLTGFLGHSEALGNLLLLFFQELTHKFIYPAGKEETLNLSQQVFNNQLLRSLGPLFGDANADETVFSKLDEPQESRDTLLEYCEPIESFLEFKNCSDQSESNFVGTTTGSTNTEGILKKDEGSGFCSGIVDQYIVPLSLVERWGSAMDILLRFYVQ